MKYRFAGLILDTDKKQLFSDTSCFHLPKKSYELLRLLLENPDTTFSRSELIEHLWAGRVVTENTVDQCISKLRKTLSSAQPGDYIESVYGHGIKFAVAVEGVSGAQQIPKKRRFQYRWLLTIVMAALIVMLGLWMLPRKAEDAAEVAFNPVVKVPVEQQSRVVWLPTEFVQTQGQPTDADHQWLNQGAAFYLKQRMAEYPNMRLQIPKKEWLQKEQETQALQLLKNSRADAVVLANIKYTDHLYRAEIKLRARSAVLGQKRFQSERLLSLFQEIEDWLSELMTEPNTRTRASISDLGLSEDAFATESYIRAMSAQLIGDSKKSITYLQTAVEQDPDFMAAWYELAVSFRKQGDYDKALSILQTITTPAPTLSFRIALTQGHVHDIQGDFEQAKRMYVLAEDIAKRSGHDRQLASLRLSEAILLRKQKDFDGSRNALKEAAALTNQVKDPHFYGSVMNTFARLEQSQKRFRDAVMYSRKAIDSFTLAGDQRYQMLATTTLSNLMFYTGQWRETEHFAESALAQAQALESPRHIRDNLEKLAMVYRYTGRLDAAVRQWQTVIQQSAELGLLGQEYTARQQLIETHMDRRSFVEAETELAVLERFMQQYSNKLDSADLLLSKLRLAIETSRMDRAQMMVDENPARDDPQWLLLKGDVLRLQHSVAQAVTTYEQAMAQVLPFQDYVIITASLNRLIDVTLESDVTKAGDLILQSGQYDPFAYPHMKYKARLAYENGRLIEAISTLKELKIKANQLWQVEDQLLLEHYEKQTAKHTE
ncbi:winged helix-turn-helix domain-containing protein [Marinicella sp. W31]|uniref:winged helix-turn-helix domain-containing protein n=1 Tax=Marinicella sp. W31 TaxID=3023713 RepID=UPI0037583848